jgi:hypothetical protein
MTYLSDEMMLVPGGLAEVEAYDALEHERRARTAAEDTAAQLAELIARENARVADAEREIADLRALLSTQTQRCERLEHELLQAGFYNRFDDPAPATRWSALKQAVRGVSG